MILDNAPVIRVGPSTFVRFFLSFLCPRPREATGFIRRDEVTVGKIPMIDWELAAIRGAIPSIEPARRNTIVFMEKEAPPDQPAADPAPPALARALREARAHITRTAHVPEQPSRSAQEQL